MRLTNRDEQIIYYMKNIGCISSSQIQRLFNMKQEYQSRRMSKLMNEFPIKKISYNPIHNFFDNNKALLKNENLFYMGRKIKCIEHDLLLNEFYIKLLQMSKDLNYEIVEYNTKYKINVDGFIVIPDVRVILKYNNIEYEYLVELENNKSFNYKKYYALEQRKYICCPILVISNRRIQNYCSNLELIKIKLNLSDIDKFINDFLYDIDYKTSKKYEPIVQLEEFSSKPF